MSKYQPCLMTITILITKCQLKRVWKSNPILRIILFMKRSHELPHRTLKCIFQRSKCIQACLSWWFCWINITVYIIILWWFPIIPSLHIIMIKSNSTSATLSLYCNVTDDSQNRRLCWSPTQPMLNIEGWTAGMDIIVQWMVGMD